MTDKSKDNPFSSFDPRQFDLEKLMGNLKLPGIDPQALIAAQQKNIEALMAAGQKTLEGMKGIAEQRAETVSNTFQEITKLGEQLGSLAKDPAELAEKNSELMHKTFAKVLEDTHQMAAKIGHVQHEAFAVISQRVFEGIEEMKSLIDKAKKP